ncbi:site-specific integrase [Methylobacterium currus]|uniref:site-specific integrase n=1 Tax=Methylobacterium currus TaxID=2051553 RepID=UPI001E2AD939|nr:site-specific integrase [Methylobacterium currus]UHC19412.1 site-specific integrase [Methylobacterium currus]
MPLPMARPWKHPDSGIYYVRKAVPVSLRSLVGRSIEKLSLRTKDPDEARARFADAVREIEARWATLAAGPSALSEREAHELASPVWGDWVALHRDNPSRNPWRTDLFERLWRNRRAGLWGRPDLIHQVLHGEYADRGEDGMEVLCYEQADQLIEAKGLVVDKDGRRTLARAVGAALQRASLTLERFALGDVGDEAPPVRSRLAASVPAAKFLPSKVEFDELVKGWAAERKPAEKTLYDWKRVMVQLAEFLGHRDAARVTSEDLIAWKNSLVASGLAAKTIRESRLAPVRAILRWGVDNRRLTDNAAERITISVKQKPGQGKRGFKDAEAAQILQAAATESDPVKRWVPLVCAYSGARLSEVCQLRVQDISEVDGIPVMHFDAEAGSLKNVGSERTVPLHSALVTAGFLDFVRRQKAGPLFPDLPPDKFGKRGGNGTKILGRWVRGLGLTDPRLAPNHSWRHRFKTLARNHGLASDVTDAITGHAHRSVGDGYGEYDVRAMKREIEKIPKL